MGLSAWLSSFSVAGTKYELPPPNDKEKASAEELEERRAYMLPTGERDIWSNEVLYHGLSPEKLKTIVNDVLSGEESQDYLQLAEELETVLEPHYRTVIGQRKDAVCALPVRVVAASEAKKDQDLTQELRELVLNHKDWARALRDLLDALGKGFAAIELIWELKTTSYGQRWCVKSMERVDPRWLRYYGGDGKTLGLRQEGTQELEPLQKHKWIIHEPHLLSAPPIKGGLALPVLFLAMLKRFNMNQWARYVERYGKPTRVGHYPKWATEKGKRTLARAVASVGVSMGVVIPEGMMIEALEDKGSNRTAQYQNLAQFINREISKLVLQQTMTTEDGSSRSQAETHNKIRLTMRDADAAALGRTLRQYLLRSYVELNHPAGTQVPRLELTEAKAEDLDKLVQNVARLVPLGLQVSAAELRERLGLREPQDGEVILGLVGKASPEANAPNAHNKTSGGIALNREESPAPHEKYAEDEEYEAVSAEICDELLQAAQGSGSFAEFEAQAGKLSTTDWPGKEMDKSLTLGQFKAFADGVDGAFDG